MVGVGHYRCRQLMIDRDRGDGGQQQQQEEQWHSRKSNGSAGGVMQLEHGV